ncbi:LysR family transcriptional regulator [Actinopolymorpha sp. B17G11]|uniref:LysR family transcriptional regulator n=1 Tax=Actinopolymorpha sp. B17G11 TaxID=3160861 RepID=UPI0032E3E3A1
MELSELKIFLTLCEELHFGRTAERLRIPQSNVSRVITRLERQLGNQLFRRTSRRVELTASGALFRSRVEPAYCEIQGAVEEMKGCRPVLRVGFTATTGGRALTRLLEAYSRRYPETVVEHVELPLTDRQYDPLREDRIDVLCYWRSGAAPTDLVEDVTIARPARVIAMSADHPLAGEEMISATQIDSWIRNDGSAPPAVLDLLLPPRLPDGTPVRVTHLGLTTLPPLLMRIVRGDLCHATVDTLTESCRRDDIAFVPATDLPPLELCLVRRHGVRNLHLTRLIDLVSDATTASPAQSSSAVHLPAAAEQDASSRNPPEIGPSAGDPFVGRHHLRPVQGHMDVEVEKGPEV